MDALDRYLKAAEPFLPRARRHEILPELRENFRLEIEERERAVGRPLSETEREQVLERHGSPLQVASRYHRPGRRLWLGRELIGPALFPHYIRALLIVPGITLAVFSALAIAKGSLATFRAGVLPVSVQLAVITLGLIAIEIAQKRYQFLDQWKPRSTPPMELLRRYLHALRFWLPKTQREDIVAELAEDLRSEIENREAELGRKKVEEAEVVAILRQRGEPMLLASRYLPQQHLIGPAFLPVYWFILKLLLLWILAPVFAFIVGPIAVRTGADPALGAVKTVWQFLMASVFAVGVVTLVFTAMERYPRRSARVWDPRKLPAVPPKPALDRGPASPYHFIAEVVMSAAFGLGWAYVRSWGLFEIEGVRIVLAPIWHTLQWPILAVLLSGVPAGFAGLLRPEATRLHSAIRLAGGAAGLVVTAILLNAGAWVQVSHAEAEKAVNHGMWIGLLVTFLVTAIDAVQEARRIFGKKTAAGPAMA